MSENKAKRVSTFAGYKLKEEDIGDEDKEMWSEIKEVADSNKELRTRVAELEKEIKDRQETEQSLLSELNQYKSKTVNVVAFHKLEDRLSTLLKASEGMEKALEEGTHMVLRSLDSAGDDEHEFWRKPRKHWLTSGL
jgi:chromosome condensin MukBEF ATPase and DNA-binding subunit MukB